MKNVITVVLALTASCLALPAWAQDEGEPRPIDEQDVGPWDHFDLSMGFMAGGRNYSRTNFHGPEGMALSFDPNALQLDDVRVGGLRYELRQVVSYLRLSAGVDIPFASFDFRETNVRRLTPWELRFGIGLEFPIGPVAPYVDLIGGVHWVNASALIDGVETSLRSKDFAFSARTGLRIHVRRWFFATASGEVGLTGDVRWGAELSIGCAIL